MTYNIAAHNEREANKKYIRVSGDESRMVLTVDTSKVTYNGFKWADLGDFGKRKFENLLILANMKGDTQVKYV